MKLSHKKAWDRFIQEIFFKGESMGNMIYLHLSFYKSLASDLRKKLQNEVDFIPPYSGVIFKPSLWVEVS